MVRFKYIRTVNGAERVTTDLLIRGKPILGVKCYGVNINAKGTVTLISMATLDGDIFLFDVKCCPEIIYSGGLLRVFQSAEILKVFHDCSGDYATLKQQFGIDICNYFDTQIAYIVIMDGKGICPRRLTLQQVCEELKIPYFMPSPQLQKSLQEDVHIWAQRPCPQGLLNLAASEVMPLIPELYQKTKSLLPEKSIDWFEHLSEENRFSLSKGLCNKGRKSRTQCPKDRQQTNSIHLVPYPQQLHFCV